MRVWIRPISRLAFGLLIWANVSCSGNILETFSKTDTNQSLFEDAQTAINSADYNRALSKIASMSGNFPNTAPVLELKASAFAGLCGFNFLNFVTALQGIGAQNLFKFLLATFDAGMSANINNCVSAQNAIQSIGPVGLRSTDENFFLAMLAFAKVGNILSFYADPTHVGTAVAGYDSCAVGALRTAGSGMTDSDARELGVGLSIAAVNLASVSGKVTLASGILTAINGVCGALPASSNFCAVTDPAALTVNEVKGVRSLVKESTVIGLGANCVGDVTVCNCP